MNERRLAGSMWTLRTGDGVLELVIKIPGHTNGVEYCVDLARCKTSAHICDWLAQVAEKNWASQEVLGGLVIAFDLSKGLRPSPEDRCATV